MAYEDVRGRDPIYDRLRFGDGCEYKLMLALDSNELMDDPREAPPVATFTVADAALFILLRRHGIPVEEIMPPELAAKMPDTGIFEYFAFAHKPEGRAYVIKRLKEEMAKRAAVTPPQQQ
jgi:hypothetical protein